MNPYTIIFIGPQGSGKGTQIEKLDAVVRNTDPAGRVVTIQTGRLFRGLAHKQISYTERHISETIDTGILQPHFLTVVLWGEVMADQLDPHSHLLIDGFPRTLSQAEMLEDAFQFYGRDKVTVINLTAPDEIVRARMQGRARPDDTPVAIAERLRLYHEETVPVLDFYRARASTTIVDIDATDTIEGIHKAILAGVGLNNQQEAS